MTNRELAIAYLECFCAGDVAGLAPLLAADLEFKGTLHHYDSRAEYLQSLERDPPGKCGYRVLSVTENDNSVCLFYDYEKPNGVITIAQLFKIVGQKISEVILVFDGRGLD